MDQAQLEALQNELKELKRALHASIAGILVTDGDLIIHFVNTRWEELSGYTASQLLGKPLSTLFNDITWIEKAHEDKEMTLEIEGKGVEKPFWVWARATVSENDNGAIDEIVITAQNVTKEKEKDLELKERTKELEKANKLMTGRELRMIELKKEIKELEAKCSK